MIDIEHTIALEAEDYPELRDLHAGGRRRMIDRAVSRLRRRRPYWLISLIALAPGVLLILVTTRETVQVRHGWWIAWVCRRVLGVGRARVPSAFPVVV